MDTTTTVEIDEGEALRYLARRLKDRTKYTHIVTKGRGGLSVAQRLAYLLDIPVYIVTYSEELRHLKSDDLFVDDIVCSGATIACIPREVDIAVLVYRKSALHKPTYQGLVYEGEEYIKFSWETV